ncbi:hypothetical protein CIFRMM251M_16640 [Citrobacter freundii]|uniref:hypothetical protein n=1 Tax=Citrobacter freundii TaxID=546 RepID=UPI001A308118|nr:hypothetical protein [Citrobacter freundii]
MKDEKKVLNQFIRNVVAHRLSVVRDDGVYRHLRFQRPGTNSYYFDLVTWPGYLTVTGDMGTWTFSRIEDMFEFFTSKHFERSESFLINPGYWSEKIEAGTHGGRDAICYEFDEDAFEKGLKEWLAAWREDKDEDDIESAEYVISSLVGEGFRDANIAVHAVYNNADWPRSVDTYDLAESISYNLNTYSFHFLWICYAIVWGIERYRSSKLVDKATVTFLAFKHAQGGAA